MGSKAVLRVAEELFSSVQHIKALVEIRGGLDNLTTFMRLHNERCAALIAQSHAAVDQLEETREDVLAAVAKAHAVSSSGRAWRKELMALQKGRCGICGSALLAKVHVDHIVPLSLGGATVLDNLQVVHPSCNSRKGSAFWQRERFGDLYPAAELPTHLMRVSPL